jgi:hypothetical protein
LWVSGFSSFLRFLYAAFLSGFNIRADNLFLASLMSDASDLALIESKMRGKTLLVYWYLLGSSSSRVGVREVQRSLGFSSPSVAAHHLNKLLDLRLVDKSTAGEYFLIEAVDVGILRFFTRLGRFLVPRYLFYSVLLTTMLIIYLIFCGWQGYIPNLFALIFGSIACVILWFETLKLWRQRPF